MTGPAFGTSTVAVTRGTIALTAADTPFDVALIEGPPVEAAVAAAAIDAEVTGIGKASFVELMKKLMEMKESTIY